jgi:hypothetical protein
MRQKQEMQTKFKKFKEWRHVGDEGIDRKITRKTGARCCGLGLNLFKMNPMTISFKHDDESMGSTKIRQFFG